MCFSLCNAEYADLVIWTRTWSSLYVLLEAGASRFAPVGYGLISGLPLVNTSVLQIPWSTVLTLLPPIMMVQRGYEERSSQVD
jgi:hypothetical protein